MTFTAVFAVYEPKQYKALEIADSKLNTLRECTKKLQWETPTSENLDPIVSSGGSTIGYLISIEVTSVSYYRYNKKGKLERETK